MLASGNQRTAKAHSHKKASSECAGMVMRGEHQALQTQIVNGLVPRLDSMVAS